MRSGQPEPAAVLEQRFWFWGRWATNVLLTMHVHAAFALNGTQLFDVDRWSRRLLAGEGSKEQLIKVTTKALADLPRSGGEPRIQVAMAMAKKMLGADEVLDVEAIQMREVNRYVQFPLAMSPVEITMTEWCIDFVRTLPTARLQGLRANLTPDLPFSPGATHAYGRATQGYNRAVAAFLRRGYIKSSWTCPSFLETPSDTVEGPNR